jgi:hypothetical protein
MSGWATERTPAGAKRGGIGGKRDGCEWECTSRVAVVVSSTEAMRQRSGFVTNLSAVSLHVAASEAYYNS